MHIEMKNEETVYVKVVRAGAWEGTISMLWGSTAMQSRQINGCVVGNLHHSKQ